MRIRLAVEADLPWLNEIEQSAGRRYADLGMLDVSTFPNRADGAWAPHCATARLWIAADDADQRVGFLGATKLGGLLFIDELAVSYEHQNRGVGAALLAAAERGARDQGLGLVVLTTFEQVPFNAPYYQRRGYAIIADDDLPVELRPVLQAERKRWTTPGRRRCAMAKPV